MIGLGPDKNYNQTLGLPDSETLQTSITPKDWQFCFTITLLPESHAHILQKKTSHGGHKNFTIASFKYVCQKVAPCPPLQNQQATEIF